VGPKLESRDFFAVTLVLVLLSATFVTAAPDGHVARLVTVALLGLTLVAAVRASGATPRELAAAAALSGAAVIAAAVGIASGQADVTLPHILSVVLVTVAPVALVRGVVAEVRAVGVTLRAVLGAIAIYLLLGMLFALFISTVASLDDAAYFGARGDATASERLYFSYVTLATLGYGDFTPATSVGRALAMLEGVLGQLYLVTIVSLMVGNIRRPRDRIETP
jgi:Ion channel